jgi:hypothetical protein
LEAEAAVIGMVMLNPPIGWSDADAVCKNAALARSLGLACSTGFGDVVGHHSKISSLTGEAQEMLEGSVLDAVEHSVVEDSVGSF